MSGAPLRLLLRGWFLLVLFLHAACTPSGLRGAPRVVLSSVQGESADGKVRLSLPTRFGAVRVSDFEFDSVAECRAALMKTLSALAKEIATPGTELNQLITRNASR